MTLSYGITLSRFGAQAATCTQRQLLGQGRATAEARRHPYGLRVHINPLSAQPDCCRAERLRSRSKIGGEETIPPMLYVSTKRQGPTKTGRVAHQRGAILRTRFAKAFILL